MGQLKQIGRGIFLEEEVPDGSSELEDVFREGGLMSQAFAGYTVREGQLQMARGVETAFTAGRHLIVNAPCGTGKGQSYSVPAIQDLFRRQGELDEKLRRDYKDQVNAGKLRDGDPWRMTAEEAAEYTAQPVTITTASINLQEQLINKDLPALQRVLGRDFTFALRKGRSNFACLSMTRDHAWREPGLGPADAEQARKIAAWTKTTKTGDRSELPFEPSEAVWRRFTIANDDCPRGDCPFYKECFGFKAQRTANKAQVIVTNHHTLVTDAMMPGVLPGGPLIVDEAHELPDIARDLMGGKLNLGGAYAAANAADRGLSGIGHAVRNLKAQCKELFERLTAHSKTAAYKVRLKEPGLLQAKEMIKAFLTLAEDCARAAEVMEDPIRRGALKTGARRCETAARLLQLADAVPENTAISLEAPPPRGGDLVTIVIRLVDPSAALREAIWMVRPTVIATSATITVAGNFSYMLGELGAPQDKTDLLDVPSPFDLAAQAMLVCPRSVTVADGSVEEWPDDPNSDEFRRLLPEAMRQVVMHARGGTLLLFTSYRNLELVHSYLVAQRVPLRLLKQGDAPRTMLIDEFRRDKDSVLLGVTSMWTGIDVVGDSLRCVAMDKLPFPQQDDPVLNYISDHDPQGWFMEHSLPPAVIAFTQGGGRLIRSIDDLGVIVAFDKRIYTKRYGSIFLKAMRPILVSRDLDDIGRFFTAVDERRAEQAEAAAASALRE